MVDENTITNSAQNENLENSPAKQSKKKRDNSPEAKKRRTRIALLAIGIIVGIFILFIIIVAIGNAITDKAAIKYANSFEKVSYENQLKPTIDPEDGYYTFTTSKPFKVVQLTDIHIGGGLFSSGTDKNVLNAIAAMVTAEKPDLVIATGDIAYPVVFAAGTTDNKKSAKAFAEVMESLGVYWTMVFGNHDTEAYSKFKKEVIAEMYQRYEYCLMQNGDSNLSGIGNSIIKIKNPSGLVTRALVMLDSHQYKDDDKWGLKWRYDNIKTDQTKWYEEEMQKLNAKNTTIRLGLSPEAQLEFSVAYNNIPSSVFFHIPIKEFRDAYLQYKDNNFKDTDNVKYFYGRIGESGKYIYHGVGEDNVYATMQKAGADSMFCGHDHYNNISLSYSEKEGDRPIRLTYGLSLDYLAYPGIAQKGAQRGCTVIMYDGQAIDITPENYYQDKYISKYKKESVKIKDDEVPKK